MQHRVAIWVTEAFHTSPIDSIEAIAGLISIYLYLKKLYSRFLLREFLLSPNHIIKLFITYNNPQSLSYHQTLLTNLTSKQFLYFKSLFIDIDNRYNKFFPAFSLLDKEFSLVNCLCDSFPNHASFHSRPQNFQNLKIQIHKLNNIIITFSLDSLLCIVVSDASIRNCVVTSISHIHLFDWPVVKTCYQPINISTTKAKLFAIRCDINQAVGIPNIKKIIVITNLLYAARRIFDSSSHPYLLQSAAISCELVKFFHKDINNSIEF